MNSAMFFLLLIVLQIAMTSHQRSVAYDNVNRFLNLPRFSPSEEMSEFQTPLELLHPLQDQGSLDIEQVKDEFETLCRNKSQTVVERKKFAMEVRARAKYWFKATENALLRAKTVQKSFATTEDIKVLLITFLNNVEITRLDISMLELMTGTVENCVSSSYGHKVLSQMAARWDSAFDYLDRLVPGRDVVNSFLSQDKKALKPNDQEMSYGKAAKCHQSP